MSLAGEDTPRNIATTGDNVSINVVIRPEEADIGALADIIIVDFVPPSNLKMRNADGIFVPWGGKLSTLEPYLEGVTLTAELEAEVFTGQLGLANDHRIFIGFLVDDALYFTPQALRFSITEEVTGPTPREQAITLFESTISPNIVQARCIQCHVAGGTAAGQALHQFVRTTNANHLDINFQEFEELHSATSTAYILLKVQNMNNHGGGLIFNSSSQQYRDLEDFLELLDQAGE